MYTADEEMAVRSAAMAWLTRVTADGASPVTREQLADFTYRGERFPLVDPMRGIRKPRGFSSALSILTTYRPDGSARPYEDGIGSDGLQRYKYRGDDPEHPENRALREAARRGDPLIWFVGIAPSTFQAVFPVYLVAEDQARCEFSVATDGLQHLAGSGSLVEEAIRRYARRETLTRLHQPVFRAMVLRAYEGRCAVCALGHGVLLDAAHIVEDRHELGVAAVRNGLALCKIHHAAFDANILGVNPNLVVEIRADILEEVDGPLLEHGIKGLHGQSLRVPARRQDRPDRDLLAIHYERFLAG